MRRTKRAAGKYRLLTKWKWRRTRRPSKTKCSRKWEIATTIARPEPAKIKLGNQLPFKVESPSSTKWTRGCRWRMECSKWILNWMILNDFRTQIKWLKTSFLPWAIYRMITICTRSCWTTALLRSFNHMSNSLLVLLDWKMPKELMNLNKASIFWRFCQQEHLKW